MAKARAAEADHLETSTKSPAKPFFLGLREAPDEATAIEKAAGGIQGAG
jgi:hypothetical protein